MDTTTPRIAAVRALPDRRLEVAWKAGGTQVVDLTGWIGADDDIVAPLRDPDVFGRAAVGEHGAGITWDDDKGDLAIDAVHLERIGQEQRPFGAGEASAWQKAVGLSNHEVARLLELAPSTWNAYKAGTSQVPLVVAMACRAAERDPVVMHAHYRPTRSVGRPRRAD